MSKYYIKILNKNIKFSENFLRIDTENLVKKK